MKTLRLGLAVLAMAAWTGCATPHPALRSSDGGPTTAGGRRSFCDQLCDQTAQALLNLAVNACVNAF